MATLTHVVKPDWVVLDDDSDQNTAMSAVALVGIHDLQDTVEEYNRRTESIKCCFEGNESTPVQGTLEW